MLRHPILTVDPNIVKPSVFSDLVRLYVEEGVPYFVDLPDAQGRIRLTNTETGEYVIIDSAGNNAPADSLSYLDEQTGCIYPTGIALRVRMASNEFRYCYIPERSFRAYAERAILGQHVGLVFSPSTFDTSIYVTLDAILPAKLSQMRLAQLKAVYDV